MAQKRVLAIHDISCIGRCSLTVALPVISAAGAECTVIPTAVLSTHTGGFTGYTYRDLTDDIVPIVDHWMTLGLRFDAVYTGFLGSLEQIDIVSDTIDRLSSEDTIVIVDPVMADFGKLYPVFGKDFPAAMRRLCSKADVIMPNITEATLMLGEEYREGPYTMEYIEGLIDRLAGIGAGKIVLTGVYFDEHKLGSATFDSETGERSLYLSDRFPGYYHGTGDVFGSAVVAALIIGRTLSEANRIAVDYTVGSIKRTFDRGSDVRFGVDFEEGIPELIENISESDSMIARRVHELACRIWHECYSDVLPPEQIDYMLDTYHSEGSVLEELSDGYVYRIISEGGKDIGYCGFRAEDDSVYIGKLYLLEDYRGKGFGSRMFSMIDSYALSKGIRKEYLRVNRNNPTVAIYERKGFTVRESVVTDIGNGFVMDDHIMERTL